MGASLAKAKIARINKNGKSDERDQKEQLLSREKKNAIIRRFSYQDVLVSPAVRFPSTDIDIDYLHEHHFVVKSIWSGNYCSPIKDNLVKGGFKVLDVVCGAGTFLLELSNEYQTSEFVGVDKTNLFPKEIKPNNVTFINADILEGLPFPDNHFDFVHLNIIETIFCLYQWDYVINELLRVTKPGGYVEVQGFDFSEENFGPKFLKYIDYYAMLFDTNGTEMKPRNHIRVIFSNPQFETSDQDCRIVPIGKFGGNIGIIFEQHCTMFYEAVKELLCGLLDMSGSEYDQGWQEVLKELDGMKTTCECYRIWGKKK